MNVGAKIELLQRLQALGEAIEQQVQEENADPELIVEQIEAELKAIRKRYDI